MFAESGPAVEPGVHEGWRRLLVAGGHLDPSGTRRGINGMSANSRWIMLGVQTAPAIGMAANQSGGSQP